MLLFEKWQSVDIKIYYMHIISSQFSNCQRKLFNLDSTGLQIWRLTLDEIPRLCDSVSVRCRWVVDDTNHGVSNEVDGKWRMNFMANCVPMVLK